MELNRLTEGRGTSIVQVKSLSSLEVFLNSNPPKRSCSPFGRERVPLGVTIVEFGTHIVEKQVRIGVKLHSVQNHDLRPTRAQDRDMASRTSDRIEDFFTSHYIRIRGIPSGRHP